MCDDGTCRDAASKSGLSCNGGGGEGGEAGEAGREAAAGVADECDSITARQHAPSQSSVGGATSDCTETPRRRPQKGLSSNSPSSPWRVPTGIKTYKIKGGRSFESPSKRQALPLSASFSGAASAVAAAAAGATLAVRSSQSLTHVPPLPAPIPASDPAEPPLFETAPVVSGASIAPAPADYSELPPGLNYRGPVLLGGSNQHSNPSSCKDKAPGVNVEKTKTQSWAPVRRHQRRHNVMQTEKTHEVPQQPELDSGPSLPSSVLNEEFGLWEFRHMLGKEQKSSLAVASNSLRLVSPEVRKAVVDWILDVGRKLMQTSETLYLAVQVFDRYTTKSQVVDEKVSLVAGAALLLASKFQEVDPLEAADMLYSMENNYSIDELRHLECSILNLIDFAMTTPTAANFLRHLLAASRKCSKTEDKGHDSSSFSSSSASIPPQTTPQALPLAHKDDCECCACLPGPLGIMDLECFKEEPEPASGAAAAAAPSCPSSSSSSSSICPPNRLPPRGGDTSSVSETSTLEIVAWKILDLSLPEQRFTIAAGTYQASEVASAALLLSRHLLQCQQQQQQQHHHHHHHQQHGSHASPCPRPCPWPDTLKRLTKYTEENLAPCMNLLGQLIEAAPENPALHAVPGYC